LPRQLRLPEFRQDQPKGGNVEKGRGKKSRKTGWHLNLGLKDAIFASIGVVGLMMMSFAVGVLAGRGDIYRMAYSWGLLTPAGVKVAQWTPPPGPTAAPAPAATPVPAAKGPLAAKPGLPAPVTGSLAPVNPPAAATATLKKKGKTGTARRDFKSQEEELQRLRRELVQKLKFQNSFDNTPQPRSSKSRSHEKAQAKSQPSLVRVARYRTSKAAQAKVTELHRKGIKAIVKQTKDAKGTWYIVYKPGHLPSGTGRLARKPHKDSGASRKPKSD
jgi:Skp family chaperone for outer membrane proteins